ncbi:MAG: class IV adenylate cyclase [Chloroflexi bacterium]|nr:class IV adenylate cyclase [Chloroflexota bacterium]
MTTPAAAHLEIEVKARVADLAPLRAALAARAAAQEQPRLLEVNLRFDTPAAMLAQRGEILRLRRSRDVRLTHKRPAQPAGELLGRPEVEVVVEDFEATREVLERSGFVVVVRYEKYRALYALGTVQVALDELPFGEFVELEGPSAQALQGAARELGLPWSQVFQGSYLSIFGWLRAHYGLTARNLTFAEFAGIELADLGLPQSAAEIAHR